MSFSKMVKIQVIIIVESYDKFDKEVSMGDLDKMGDAGFDLKKFSINNLLTVNNFFNLDLYENSVYILFDIDFHKIDRTGTMSMILKLMKRALDDGKIVLTNYTLPSSFNKACIEDESIIIDFTKKADTHFDGYHTVRKSTLGHVSEKGDSEIVTIIGSNNRYKDGKRELELALSAAGYVVYNIGDIGDARLLYSKSKYVKDLQNVETIVGNMRKNFHKMIRLSDYVVVYNKDGGYVGDHTLDEIHYALDHNIKVYALEPVNIVDLTNEKQFIIVYGPDGEDGEYVKYTVYKVSYAKTKEVR